MDQKWIVTCACKEPSTKCSVCNLISEQRTLRRNLRQDLSTKPGLQQDRSPCSTVSRTAIPCIHSDYVEVGTWLSDISIASVGYRDLF
jgi:hypothetical protein